MASIRRAIARETTVCRGGRRVIAALVLASLMAMPSHGARGQGATHASIDGVVVEEDGGAVRGAIVTLQNAATGHARRTTTSDRGTWSFDGVEAGTHRIHAQAIGMHATTPHDVVLHAGDRVRIVLTVHPLAREPATLDAVSIEASGLRDGGAGGPATSMTLDMIHRLPVLDRDFVGLFGVSSQAAGPDALWMGGQHARFNGIQIDGAIGNDLFGVNVTPGSGAGLRSVSLEALEEIRILLAPFDVRQGGFSGGLVNAVTRSGTNDTRGSGFTSYSRSGLVGSDTTGSTPAAFEQIQYGASAGGPLVRDRLWYFAAAEVQSRSMVMTAEPVDAPTTGITTQTAERAARVFRDRFLFDPGGPHAPTLRQPDTQLFAKVSWRPSDRHAIELTQWLSRGSVDQVNRAARTRNNVDGWQLSNSGVRLRGATGGIRVQATSIAGGLVNEATVGFTSNRDARDSRHAVPLFLVKDLDSNYLAAGSVKSAQGTRTSTSVLELADNLMWHRGNHHLSLGTQNAIVRVRDTFFPGSWGVWTFPSVGALERNEPSRYEIALPGEERGPSVAYRAVLAAAYGQYAWRPSSGLGMSIGLRLDVPFFASPARNDSLAGNQLLGGIDTGDFPSGNALLSPRIGFSWRPGIASRTMVRGGVGVFAGRPPFVWLTGAYSGTGREQRTLICVGASVPELTVDTAKLPRECRDGGTVVKPNITSFDPRFRFQRTTRWAIGVDRELARSWVASLDVMYATTRDNLRLRDVNLMEQGLTAEGRTMYGVIGATGPRPARLDGARYGPVFRYTNVDSDRFASFSMSSARRWASGGVLQLGYTWSRAYDVMSATGFISPVIQNSNPVDGTIAHANRRRSARDIPHTLTALALVPIRGGMSASGFLRVRSGTPYAFTIQGDANADGSGSNDLAYIPAQAGELTVTNPELFPDLDRFIERIGCLRSQRGAIMRRNSCRNRPVATLDVRIAKRLVMRGGRGLEVSGDLFNAANLLNRRWGLVRETTASETVTLLSLSGWDSANNRPRYTIPSRDSRMLVPPVDRIALDASRWRIQLGLRYDY